MRLDTSFIVGVWLEALVYGAYVVAFAVCLRLFRTHAPVVGRALPIWLGALFVLATAHSLVYNGSPSPPFPPPAAPSGVPRPPHPSMPLQYRDPTRYIGNRALPTNLAGLGVYAGIVLLSNLMLLYRLLVKYRYQFIWVIGPTFVTIGSFVLSIIVVVKYARIDQTVNYETLQRQLENINPWVPPVYAIAFLANLSITALMMVKTSFGAPRLNNSLPAFATRRRHTHRTTLSADDGYVFDIDERTGPVPRAPTPARRRTMSSRWALFAGLVESGAFAPVFMLAALVLYVAQDAQETLLVPMLAPLAALIPTLQIIQLQLGLDSDARNRPISKAWSESEQSAGIGAGAGQGRSPYLVPAPRYHDSSSEEDVSDGEARLVNGAQARKEKSRRSGLNSNNEPVSPTTAKRFSARNMWAWRGRTSGSGSGSGTGTGTTSHAYSNSQSSGRADPPVMLQMRDLTGSAERAGENETKGRSGEGDEDVWERIKLDDSKPFVPEPMPALAPTPAKRKSTLRKNSVSKAMISKPVPIAADFPPTTANLPSTSIVPALPNFTINAETGVTPNTNAVVRNPSAGAEHKYHYRVRPREKTASPLAAYLSAQALAQSSSQVDERERLYPQHQQQQHHAPPSSSGHQPASSTGHLMSLPSTTPTSPASGFTSLNPHSASRNPFRYDGQSELHHQHYPQSMHQPSYSDVRRAEPSTDTLGEGPRRAPLTVPFPTSEPADLLPRWAPMPGAPRIVGLDTFFPPGRVGRHGEVDIERDMSPAPGLKRDYTLARAEALKQMEKDKGAMSDDESVYSTQLLAQPPRR
ncbi:hypothetical protein BN14_07467 [Rhizoctonia solani AG-1 IB]|uniref:Uncharacterized protein n=1 Tax=Thanatephorus cucumeris (strain AG1-IB / isolate 7/3/14) TaxID=1108050 RepID=M5CC15_THACB|nr:hypothetical protein BN14_07467 [Rhizoctonia solani AG-1 IB]